MNWEGGFQYPRRLSHMWIRWAYAPGKYRILSSVDGEDWKEEVAWQTGYKGVLWQWLSKIFWWWKWFYKSYAEYIPFPSPIWAKKLRIQMKENVFKFFGIYRVEAWMKKWLVMLRSSAVQSTGDWCLVSADSKGIDGREVQLMDCSEAIAAGDGRELWTLSANFQISSYIGSKCIEAAEGETANGARIQVNDCWLSESAGDGREKWVTGKDGLLRLYKDESKCLTALSNNELDNVCFNRKVIASSTMADGQHEAHMAVDGYRDNFWASAPGDTEATFTIFFDGPKILKELTISWKYPAEEFEVLGLLSKNLWESLGFFRNDGKSVNTNKVSILGKGVLALKLVMMKTKESFKGQLIYGIGDIFCTPATKSVKLQACNEFPQSKTNAFEIEDVGFIDLTAGPRFFQEKASLVEKTNKLLLVVQNLVQTPQKIYKFLEKGRKVQETIKILEERLKSIDTKLTIFHNFLDSDEQNILSAVGSTALNPVKECSYIKSAFPHKGNGFYWVQPECGKKPLRVFCQFGQDYGKGYVFIPTQPNTNQKISSQNSIHFICGKEGLFPLDLTSVEEIDIIIGFLNNIGIQLEENEMIPFGYDWGCELGSCTGTFRSFSTEKSRDFSDEFHKKLDQSNILNMAFNLKGYIKDTIAISRDLNAGFIMVKLDSFKTKGAICEIRSSNNFDEEGFISNFPIFNFFTI